MRKQRLLLIVLLLSSCSSVPPVLRPGVRAYDGQRWSEAQAAFEVALREVETSAPGSPLLAMTLYYLGSTQYNLSRPADAEVTFRRALDIFDRQSGRDDIDVARLRGMTLNDLGVIVAVRAGSIEPAVSRRELLEEAERLYRRALAIREESDPSQVGRTLGNLTQVYFDLERWSDAAIAGERALSFYERQSGRDEQVVYELDRLTDIYLRQGRLAEVEPVIRRVVQGMQKTLGPNHPAIARRLESYAIELRKAGREADAREVEAEARKVRANVPTRP